MATPNGATKLSDRSPSSEPASGTKRKRHGSHGDSARHPVKKSTTSTGIQSTITDVFEVLSSHDTAPAILNFPIDAKDEAPTPRKAKANADDEPTTVSRKVKEATYATLDELEQDIQGICAAQIASLREQDEEEDSKPTKRLSGDDVIQMQDIMSFELFVREIVDREKRLLEPREDNKSANTNGTKEEETEEPDVSTAPDTGRTVLSLYGNAPTGRQLFSSLQEEAGTDISLEELGLPTMLVASKLLPTVEDDSRPKRTIGSVFTPSASLAALQPPPKSRASSSRSTNISFLSADKFGPKPSRKGPYPLQPLTSGKWLRYGSQIRRKGSLGDRFRDRSNSVAERPQLDQPSEQAFEPSEEDLFTAAYSSFAPTQDNSRAVVPADTCDLLWWQKVGKRKLGDIASRDSPLAGMELDEPEDDATPQDHEVESYQHFVDSYDEEDTMANLVEETNDPDDMESHALLSEINELLHTLSSHQRIRQSILQPGSLRAPTSPSPFRNTLVGTPSEPSEDEKTVYQNLQKHLASLIARLPPYLVAKLDGVQVEDLSVSRTFLVEGRSTRGVMEEDQATRAARGAAAAAASAASKTQQSQSYGQYGRWPGMSGSGRQSLTPQSAQRAPVNYGRSSGLAAATPTQTSRQYASYSSSGTRTSLQPNYGQAGAAGQQYYQRYGQQQSQGSPQARPQQFVQQYQQRYAQQTPSYAKSFPQQGQNGTTPTANTGGAMYQGSPVRLGTQVNGTQ